MALTVGSLFSGIGGIDLACEWAGMEVIWQCEIDLFCQQVLRKHWPEVKLYDDIHAINKHNTIRPDILVGGFPCQPYSIAGKRAGKEDDRDLWPEMFRVISEFKPTWIVGENVANFVRMELERTLLDLESEGYEAQTFIIPALGIGAPHKRDRTFIVGHLTNSNSFGHKRTKRLQKNIAEIEQRRKSTLGTTTKLFNDIDWEERARKSGFLGRGDGVPDRMDRIKALGNAVVPQQVYPIMQAIANIERGVDHGKNFSA